MADVYSKLSRMALGFAAGLLAMSLMLEAPERLLAAFGDEPPDEQSAIDCPGNCPADCIYSECAVIRQGTCFCKNGCQCQHG